MREKENREVIDERVSILLGYIGLAIVLLGSIAYALIGLLR